MVGVGKPTSMCVSILESALACLGRSFKVAGEGRNNPQENYPVFLALIICVFHEN